MASGPPRCHRGARLTPALRLPPLELPHSCVRAAGTDKAERKERRKAEKRAAAAKRGEEPPETGAARQADAAPPAEVGDAQLARDSAPIVKALYTEHEETAAMSAADVAAFCEERDIAVTGSELRPVQSFHQLGLKKKLLRALRDFKKPSPIQAQCWPIVLSGRDLIGIAATGSGERSAGGHRTP